MIALMKRPKRTKRQAMPAWMTADESRLWSLYLSDRCDDNRNAIVLQYMPFVNSVALRIAKRTGVSLDDLMNDGVFGLMKALGRFDMTHGTRFTSYAERHIRGAMIDAIRKNDYVARGSRARVKHWNEVSDELQSHTGLEPSDDEIADAMKLSVKSRKTLRDDRRVCRMFFKSLSQDRYLSNNDSGNNEPVLLGETLVDKRARQVSGHAEQQEWWHEVLCVLRPTERAVVILYWVFGWTMRRIGRHMGMSESRISQLNSSIIATMAKYSEWSSLADIPNIGGECWKLTDILPHCSHLRRMKRARMARKRPRKAGAA